MKEYREQLNFLRSFEVSRPGIKEYTKVQREKTMQAIESALGVEISAALAKKMKKMSAPQLSEFWNSFSDKASKMGMQYSSTAAMNDTLAEFFPEDMQQFNNVQAEQAMVMQYQNDMARINLRKL